MVSSRNTIKDVACNLFEPRTVPRNVYALCRAASAVRASDLGEGGPHRSAIMGVSIRNSNFLHATRAESLVLGYL